EQVDALGIERSEQGWVADAYIYCAEVVDPATGWTVPLAPSWVIASKTNVIARLVPNPVRRRFEIHIVEDATTDEMRRAAASGGKPAPEATAVDGVRSPVGQEGLWLPPERRLTTSFEQLRGREGLRLWTADDIA